MRSIRRSMTGYLLALLTITLGIVAVVIDQVTGRTLDARQKAAIDLIDAQYTVRCQDERRRVDESLRKEAEKLGREMEKEYFPSFRQELNRFYAVRDMLLFGSGQALTSAYHTVNARTVNSRLYRDYFSHLPIDKAILLRLDEQERASDYFQINSSSGRTRWRSDSLDEQTLPFDHPDEPRYDDAALVPSGEPVRRVVLPVRLSFVPFGPPGNSRGRGERRPSGSSGSRPPLPPPTGRSALVGPQPGETAPRIFVQCARPLTELSKVLAGFQQDHDEQLTTVAADVSDERVALRTQLAIIGLATFAAIAIGGPLFVGAQLRPLRALSDAVSQVSERDFKLPHDGRHLPKELSVIHARLTSTLDMLRRAFAREKQAVADISHELRTPIASLQATFDVALRKTRTPEQYRATLDECRLINKQLGQLVERIMTLASLDAGNDRTNCLRVDAAEIAAACVAVIRPLAVAHAITVDSQIDGPLEVETDPDKFREVMMNLLHNAVEYNRPGGAVRIVGRPEAKRIVFEVRDTGIGMPAEVRERIFERFFRADASRHATGVHAGLGLAIVKEYIGRLGGTIDVASEPGKGSCFQVNLPAPQDIDSPQAVLADHSEPVGAAS